MNNIIVKTEFIPSDMVQSVIEPEEKYFITSLNITQVKDEEAEVSSFDCSDSTGKVTCFKPYEIKLYEHKEVI